MMALAMVGYEMFSGRAPFSEYKGARLMVAHFTEMPQPLGQLRPEVPDAVVRVLEKGMAKEPTDRFADAAEFREALGGRW